MRILEADQAVLDHVSARADALVDRAVAWAEVNSGSRNAAGLNQVLDLLDAQARTLPAVAVARIATQASTTVGSASAGAIGPLTASVLSLATAAPPHRQASISRINVQRRASPNHRPANHTKHVTTAAAISGHPAGSTFSVK